MEINVHKFQEAILAGTFEHTAVHVTAAAFKKDGIADALTKVFADVRAAIEKDQLIQADLVVDFPEPTTITVETGIINLPFANVNKIPNFLEPDEIVPVRVYLIVHHLLSTYQVCALMKPRLPLIICRILTRSMPK